eukprot:jgi/Undpi1/9399/HiC_scaffold_27.g11856.m1
MAKSDSRCKGSKSKASGGGGPGSAPSSPTRRLKKGGKRGRRLCHMDGCTLCPSFGFEGEVAVSCSHHKEEGMRNLTARRCQHEGCFTVANFGMPGDKPGYCAAHSTEGMVNRNKPRGAEGMLAGVTIARSSRRASKANTVLLEAAAEAARVAGTPSSRSSTLAAAAAAAAAGAARAARSRFPASSGGKDLLLRVVAAAARNGGGLDLDEELPLGKEFGSATAASAAGRGVDARSVVGSRARTSGRLRVARGENSDSEELPDFHRSSAVVARGRGENSPGGVVRRKNPGSDGKVGGEAGDHHGSVSGIEERRDRSMPASFVTFVSRGEDIEPVPPGPPPSSFSLCSSSSSSSSSCSSSSSSSSSAGRRVDGCKGGGGRTRPRGGHMGSKGFGAAAMTVTAGVLHRQETGFPGYRGGGGGGGDNFQRRYADGMSLGMGGRGGRGVGMELSFPGDARGTVMTDGPFVMEASGLGNSGIADTHLSFDLGGGLEDMLVSGSPDPSEGCLGERAFVGQVGANGTTRGQSISYSDRDSRVVTPSSGRISYDAMRIVGVGSMGIAESVGSVDDGLGLVEGVGSISGGLELAGGVGGLESSGGGIEGDIVDGEGLSVGGVGVDFELDHLPELNTIDLTGLRAVDSDCDGAGDGCAGGGGGGMSLPREPRQLSSRTLEPVTVPGSFDAAGCPLGMRPKTGKGMSRLSSANDVSAAAAAAGAGAGPGPLSSGILPTSRSTMTSVSSVSATAARSTTLSAPMADALVPAKLPCEEAWWDVLEGEGEDFVAMPEPVDAPDVMVAHDARARSSLSESPGLGDSLGMEGDVGFATGDIGRGGDAGDDGLALSGGACRGVEGSVGDGESGNGIAIGVCSGGVGGGVGGRLSPAKKRHRLALVGGAEADSFQSPFIYGSANRPIKRDLSTTAIFPSSSSLSSSSSSSYSSSSSSSYSSSSVSASFALSSGIYPAAPVSFGLTVTSNVHGPSPLPHGAAGLRSGGGLQGGVMGKAWGTGDGWVPGESVSPSKCLSLSPTQIISTSPSSLDRIASGRGGIEIVLGGMGGEGWSGVGVGWSEVSRACVAGGRAGGRADGCPSLWWFWEGDKGGLRGERSRGKTKGGGALTISIDSAVHSKGGAAAG